MSSEKMEQKLHRRRDAHARCNKLLENIKSNESKISALLARFNELEADFVYRFYHQSFKVYIGTSMVEQARDLFLELTPDSTTLNDWFQSIAKEAINKKFDSEKTNEIWCLETQPILEAFWHSKYFLQQMMTAAHELETAPEILPSGWAAVLYLYNLRY